MFKPKKADRLKYCSRQCAFDNRFNNPLLLEIKALKKIGKQTHKELLPINVLFEKRLLFKIAKANKKSYDTVVNTKKYKPCENCKKLFVFTVKMGRHKSLCNDCKKILFFENKKKNARKGKAYRRAIEKGVNAEKIDPLKVFERDNWRCHICKDKTPKKLRGTYEPKAPELDHIITLAEGGGHTYNNVACCCRSCNMKKSSKSYGQLILFGEGAG